MSRRAPAFASLPGLASALALALSLAASPGCSGDDEASATDTTTTATTATTTATTTTTTGSSTGDGSSSTETGETGSTSSTTGDASTTTDATTDATTGGGGPPDYPEPVGGICPDGTTMITVGNGSLCAPFCAGDGAACPSEGLDSASSVCTPFLDSNSGSGDDCSEGQECPDNEGCQNGSCQAILFWSCLIDCGPANECPAPLICTNQARCAYPL
jgi:hypothetical protein